MIAARFASGLTPKPVLSRSEVGVEIFAKTSKMTCFDFPASFMVDVQVSRNVEGLETARREWHLVIHAT